MKFLKRILIAEDAPDSRRVFELALCDTGEIDSARDGEAALEMYHDRAARGIAYDLILLDIAMPKINGFQVAEAIRASGDEATPIVFLTAYGEPETVGRATRSQAEVWNKPIAVDELVIRVRSILNATAEPT